MRFATNPLEGNLCSEPFQSAPGRLQFCAIYSDKGNNIFFHLKKPQNSGIIYLTSHKKALRSKLY